MIECYIEKKIPTYYLRFIQLIISLHFNLWWQHMQDEEAGRPYRKFLWGNFKYCKIIVVIQLSSRTEFLWEQESICFCQLWKLLSFSTLRLVSSDMYDTSELPIWWKICLFLVFSGILINADSIYLLWSSVLRFCFLYLWGVHCSKITRMDVCTTHSNISEEANWTHGVF